MVPRPPQPSPGPRVLGSPRDCFNFVGEAACRAARRWLCRVGARPADAAFAVCQPPAPLRSAGLLRGLLSGLTPVGVLRGRHGGWGHSKAHACVCLQGRMALDAASSRSAAAGCPPPTSSTTGVCSSESRPVPPTHGPPCAHMLPAVSPRLRTGQQRARGAFVHE